MAPASFFRFVCALALSAGAVLAGAEEALLCQAVMGTQAPPAPSCGGFSSNGAVPDGLVTASQLFDSALAVPEDKVNCGTCDGDAHDLFVYLCPIGSQSLGLSEARKVCVQQPECPNYGADGISEFEGFCCIDPVKVQAECDSKSSADLTAGLVGLGLLAFCLLLLAVSVFSERHLGKFANTSPIPSSQQHDDDYGDAEIGHELVTKARGKVRLQSGGSNDDEHPTHPLLD